MNLLSGGSDLRPLSHPAWRAMTALLLAGVFAEAVFAGAILSGAGWARAAHGATAVVVIVAATAAGVAALVMQRRVAHGIRLGLTLLALAGGALLQAALGALSARGAPLLWAHVPLGVALVGLAAWALVIAGRADVDNRS